MRSTTAYSVRNATTFILPPHRGQISGSTSVGAVEVALYDFLDDRPEIPILLLEPALVLREEALKIMEQHPVEDRALQMAKVVDSRHSHKADSKSVPGITGETRWARPKPGQQMATRGGKPMWMLPAG